MSCAFLGQLWTIATPLLILVFAAQPQFPSWEWAQVAAPSLQAQDIARLRWPGFSGPDSWMSWGHTWGFSYMPCWERLSDDSSPVLVDPCLGYRGPAVKWQQHQACGQSPHLWPDPPNKNQEREQSVFWWGKQVNACPALWVCFIYMHLPGFHPPLPSSLWEGNTCARTVQRSGVKRSALRTTGSWNQVACFAAGSQSCQCLSAGFATTSGGRPF